MPETNINLSQAIQNSQKAIKSGQKLVARHWAEQAAALAPEREEPWLLMAAVAHPLASVGYLNQALKINPHSTRALTGMQWAIKRVDQYKKTALEAAPIPEAVTPPPSSIDIQDAPPVTPQLETVPATPAQSPASPAKDPDPTKTAPIKVIKPGTAQPTPVKKNYNILIFILLPIACLIILGATIWIASPLIAFISNRMLPQLGAPTSFAEATQPIDLALPPIETQPPAFTPIPTNTDSVTLPPTQAPTEIPTATLEPSPTPLPTDSGPLTYIASQQTSQGQSQVPAYAGEKHIVVSISEQHMYVYEGNTLIYSFIISTGIGNATRVGTFSVLDKIPNAYGSTWDIWMPNWLGIYYAGSLENGIHALPIMSNGATLWEGYLGAPVSYGCVVLGTYDSQLLYDWAEIGVPVVIVR